MATIDTSAISDTGDEAENEADSQRSSSESSEPADSDVEASTALIEVVPGAAVVFGEVPDGLELIDFGLIPSFDRERLTVAMGAVGNGAALGGNMGNLLSNAQGLYRVDNATRALLQSGAKFAKVDGANIGALFKNGKVVAQARFIPYGITAVQAAAAIGPAIAMVALQMQLSEISGLVRTNIALTTQALKAIRSEQWSELIGLVTSIDRSVAQATAIKRVTRSIWDNVSGNEAALDKQVDLYKRNVSDHAKQLGNLHGHARRQYLETNAEAILFDSHALLTSLKAHTGYQALRAAWSRVEGVDNEHEAELAEVIAKDARAGFDVALQNAAELVESLRRELRIIAELPGRATMPLTKNRRGSKVARLTCNQLLEAIEPLANVLHPATSEVTEPELVIAPKDLDLTPYLRVLRWFLADGEELRAIAFPYQPGTHNLAGVLPPVLAARVDATWDALAPGRWAAVVDKTVSGTFIAVTDQRLITASPRGLIQRGELGGLFRLSDVKHVRSLLAEGDTVRPTLDVTTKQRDLQWLFPSTAELVGIEALATLLEGATKIIQDNPTAIEQAPTSEASAVADRGHA